MVQTIDTLFKKLKKTTPVIHNTVKVPDALNFVMKNTDQGITITPVDTAGKSVDPGYEFYSGHERKILKEISRIREQEKFTIDWDTDQSDSQFYLNGNDYLLTLLVESNRLMDENGRKITTARGEARVKLAVKQREKGVSTAIELWHGQKQVKKFFPVTETAMLSGKTVYKVPPLGKSFSALSLFETRLGEDFLEQYLSLVFSNLFNVEVTYNCYQVVQGEPQKTRPALIFANVSQNQALNLKVSAVYPGFSPDFFDNFEIDRIVSVNDLEENITVSPLIHGDIAGCFQDIHTLVKKHARALRQNDAVYVQDNFMVLEPDLATRFITEELPLLLTRYTIMGAEKLKAYKVKHVQPKLNLNLDHGIDFLEGDATLDFDGETFTLNDILRQYRQTAYIQLSDGVSAVVNPEYMKKLERIFKKKKSGVKVSFFDLPIVEELIGDKIAHETFKRSREIFLGFNKLKSSKKRLPKINATLRNYQKQGFKWVSYLHQHKLGGCLADDMGLGKTIQTIALLASIYPAVDTPTLIIMPRTLLFNWESELDRFAPDLTYTCYYGIARDIEEALRFNIILTTYAVVRNDIEQLKETPFHMVVLDESQNIKNLNSKTAKAVMLLKTDHRLALSGTPLENNLGELYSLFRFLNPAMFGNVSDFSRNYLTPIQKNNDKAVVKELKKKIYPFILRRVKKDVLKDLPDKVEQTLFVDMTQEQAELYHQRRQMYQEAINREIKDKGLNKSQFFILQALGELRQIASIPEIKSDNIITSPKREILMDHVTDAVAGRHKVLVFANYLHSLECVSQDMNQAGIDHLVMTGATRDRSSIVDRFQTDETCQALLMTLKTGGLGLNLTRADYVFLFDPWWNIAAETQAIDRAHRIGQKNTVFSYRLIAKNSIEEKILKLQEKKKELFNSLIASDNASIKQMNESDVAYVLGG
ncbi:MAG: SNF2-related protein [Thermodesulfobacteriota bacterium]|nr:SNF2-related protein [Thermodesulfobacteriota bacterium]